MSNTVKVQVIIRNDPDWDHEQVNFIVDGIEIRSRGYRGKEPGDPICFPRCPLCSSENYGPVVAKGKCGWCGFDPNTSAVEVEEVDFTNKDQNNDQQP